MNMNWANCVRSELVLVLILLIVAVHCKPVRPNTKEKEKNEEEWKKEEDPSYVKYLKQVIEILEEDESFSKKLENVTEADIRSGKIADHIDFADHHVRTKLDELKRKEIEYQRQLLRKQQDLRNGIHREYWNPLNDRENPNSFEVEDLKRLLSKHHEEMDEIDTKRKKDFQRHEMDKEHKRKQGEKNLDESKRNEAEEERKRLRQKHVDDAKKINHPGSKSQLEDVWEDDGYEKDQFDPKTFFRLHDRNGDGQLDPFELEMLFVREASKIHNRSDPDFDKRALDEEVQRMREHVVKQIDKDKDNFVSFEEFIGSTKEKEFEKPEEEWKGIDDEDEYTDDEFDQYEKEFGELDDDDEEEHNGADEDSPDEKHVPLAHNQEEEKREHHDNTAQHLPLAHNQQEEKREHGEHAQQQDHQQQTHQ